MAQKGLSQISDKDKVTEIIGCVLTKNEKAVADWQAGKQNAFQFLIGQVLTETQGRANPDIVKEILLQKLGEEES